MEKYEVGRGWLNKDCAVIELSETYKTKKEAEKAYQKLKRSICSLDAYNHICLCKIICDEDGEEISIIQLKEYTAK